MTTRERAMDLARQRRAFYLEAGNSEMVSFFERMAQEIAGCSRERLRLFLRKFGKFA